MLLLLLFRLRECVAWLGNLFCRPWRQCCIPSIRSTQCWRRHPVSLWAPTFLTIAIKTRTDLNKLSPSLKVRPRPSHRNNEHTHTTNTRQIIICPWKHCYYFATVFPKRDDLMKKKWIIQSNWFLVNIILFVYLLIYWCIYKLGSISNIDDTDYKCHDGSVPQVRNKVISGVVGASSSVTSIQVANLLRLFKIPQVQNQ